MSYNFRKTAIGEEGSGFQDGGQRLTWETESVKEWPLKGYGKSLYKLLKEFISSKCLGSTSLQR